MRNVFKSKRKISIVILFCIVVLFSGIKSYADEQKEKIFIGQFKGNASAIWCGNDALVVSSRESGIEWIDILSNKRIKISSRTFPDDYDYPLNCTPDGRWVVYVDNKSGRIDKGYEPKGSDDVGWDGGVVDLYRYEVATGKKQKFAVIRALGPFEAVSPDGTKIFLGGKHNSAIPMPEPKWNTVWFKNYDWGQSDAIWFLDSSGVVVVGHNPNRIGVEFFGKNGWAKMFEFHQFKDNIPMPVKVDKENRIYFFGTEKDKGQETFYRCSIKNKKLSCKTIPERDFSTALPDKMISMDGRKEIVYRTKHKKAQHVYEAETDVFVIKLTN